MYVCMCVHECMRVCVYACMRVCVYACVRACVLMCAYPTPSVYTPWEIPNKFVRDCNRSLKEILV